MVASLGLLMVALGNTAAREATGGAAPLFWAGLVTIYAPIAYRLLSASAARAERIALVVGLGLALFVVKVLYSPVEFVFFDELGWWRATHDLLATGHPFSSNPLVVSTPGFPGLDLLAAPLAELARLSIFHAGTIVVGAVRAALMLGLFLLLERATRSSRAAGIGVAVYACNPSFLYFNAQFAYESVSLLIGLALILATVRWSESSDPLPRRAAVALLATITLLVCTLTVTHHMTSYAVFSFLALWAVLAGLEARSRDERARSLLRGPALPAILLGLTASAWFAFVAGGVTIKELGDLLSEAVTSFVNFVLGGSGPKKPFEAGGQTNTLLARALAVSSVLALLAAIPFGLKRTWPRGDALQRALGLVAVLYVATLALRATQSGTETSQRASEFVFVGLAFLVAAVVVGMRLSPPARARGLPALGLAALATVVFLGGFVVGEPPQGRQPGPFLIAAERRSVSPQGLAAAEFAAHELPPGSRILVDHANAMLLGSYGGLDPVTRKVDGVPIARVFFGPTLRPSARRLIRDGRIEYVVIDSRLTRTPPVSGYYFTRQEPGAFERSQPLRPAALRKFHLLPGLTKIYSNGAISIYDTSRLRSR